jgi:hypothetical protein
MSGEAQQFSLKLHPPVILSAATASLREAVAKSKDPYSLYNTAPAPWFSPKQSPGKILSSPLNRLFVRNLLK